MAIIRYFCALNRLKSKIREKDEYNCKIIVALPRPTRHFGKRQLTWFRRENAVTWLDKQQFDYDEEKILEYMIKELGEKGIYEKQQ